MMNDDHPEPASPRLLVVTSPATDRCQADTRHRLERWLTVNDVAKSDIGDVVLAASEALRTSSATPTARTPSPGR